jgi:hypothetical protein
VALGIRHRMATGRFQRPPPVFELNLQ